MPGSRCYCGQPGTHLRGDGSRVCGFHEHHPCFGFLQDPNGGASCKRCGLAAALHGFGFILALEEGERIRVEADGFEARHYNGAAFLYRAQGDRRFPLDFLPLGGLRSEALCPLTGEALPPEVIR